MNHLTRIIYFGTAEFAVPALRALLERPESYEVAAVVSQPDRPAGRRGELKPSPVAALARSADLKLLQPEKLDQAAIDVLRDLSADLFIVAAYGQILPQTVLDLPPHGTLNLHGSLLPKYRGASPIQTAIRDGEPETGVTLMLMDRKMDHGPLLASAIETIRPDDDYLGLSERLADDAADLLIQNLPGYLAGELKPNEQDHEAATFTKILKKEDGRIDWTADSAVEVERRVRAYRPWPGTFFDWTDRKGQTLTVKLLRAELANAEDSSGKIGELRTGSRGSPLVTCADGRTLRLLEVQPAGKKPLAGPDFSRGFLKS
ncbi:MAG: methionyl-tRNA formyltransferase [bacterium]